MRIIDFNEKRRQKEADTRKQTQSKLLWQLQQTRKPQYLHQLVNDKQLNYEAHQLLLAFIMTVESQIDVEIEVVFADAINMTRQQFHQQYAFDWETSFQCALTFLAIQKQTNEIVYSQNITSFIKQ